MVEQARKYITDYCKKNNITPAALERDSGMTRDAIYSFIAGKVVDPKLSTMISIADLLSISLDELVGRKKFLQKPIDSNALPINPTLLKEAVSFVVSYIKDNSSRKYTTNEAIYAVNEIYEYSINNKLTKVDESFANYFCKNQMHLL